MGYLTLIEVKTRFAAWRKMKHHREPIPNELWDAAISLTEKHSICKVSKALSLCYTTLKKRAAAAQIKQSAPPLHTTQDFISLDLNSAISAECCIEMEHHNGNKLRMHFKGKAELDLQSIAESFWNKI
jgi:hypothetical protein